MSELHNGVFIPYSETRDRVDAILAALAPTELPEDRGMAAIEAVHAVEYLAFLQTAHEKWLESGRSGDAIPYTWPIVRRRAVDLDRIDALLGRFSFDAATPISKGSWKASYASAQTAIAAAQAVLDGEMHSFALCRPPGHHAGRDYFGGYCFLNVAAIAAQHVRASGIERVAILDIDYHHGNGTQDIFWKRGDVLYASLHADPSTDYPFFWGFADEAGDGAGHGRTLNLPLPRGTAIDTYAAALEQALAAIDRFDPGHLVVSFGADTWEGDPISHFSLSRDDLATVARQISDRRWPTTVIMEGGYATGDLGRNVASFLSGFEAR